MIENPAHPDGAHHINFKVHFLRDMVRDRVLNLLKVAGKQIVADARTKTYPASSSPSTSGLIRPVLGVLVLPRGLENRHLLQG